MKKPSNVPLAGAKVTIGSLFRWSAWFLGFLIRENKKDFFMNNPRNVWNIDESGMPANAPSIRAIGLKSSRRLYRRAPQNNKESFSVTVAGNANVEFIRPCFIIKGKRLSDEFVASVPDNIDYLLSDEGYQTQDTFLGKKTKLLVNQLI